MSINIEGTAVKILALKFSVFMELMQDTVLVYIFRTP